MPGHSFTRWRAGGLLLAALALSLFACADANAAITFRSSSQAAVQKAPGVVVPAPIGVQPGDVLVATVAAGGASMALSAPGWTQIRLTDAGGALDQLSFYRVASTGEPLAYTFAAPSGTDDLAAGIVAYGGVDAVRPIDAVADAKGAGTSAVPSVTTTAPGDVVVAAIALASNAGAQPDSSVALRYSSAAKKAGVVGGDFTQASAGATGARPFTTGPKPGELSVQAIALRAEPPRVGGSEPGETPMGSSSTDAADWTLSGGGTLSPDVLATLPVVSTRTPRVSSRGAVPVRVSCPATAVNGCSGTITLSLAPPARRRVVAAASGRVSQSRSFRLAAGTTATVPVRLDRRTLGRFTPRRRVIPMTLRVAVQTPSGEIVKVTTIKVRERRTPHRRVIRRRHR